MVGSPRRLGNTEIMELWEECRWVLKKLKGS